MAAVPIFACLGMIDGLPGFADPLKRLSARRGVCFVTGNHEVYAGLRRSLDVVAQAGIRVLFNEVVEEEGFAIYTSRGVGIYDPSMRTGASPEIVVFTLRAAS